ncbi:hypothetical protein JVT61DRAFT_4206 [Boletus reticuloceps]|uniref:Uncharacterized protein n=1 Tax=Boletus reticuloceps TaxID=495285 RepID=A0A8I3A7P8_9AGAM|nr:hypothetical protein JVT61DRAFT_4206 [Boletus reticuloceps]
MQALTLAREFIFGNNQTGLVTKSSSGSVVVIGGEMSSLGSGIICGEAGIYYGSATTESTYFFPSATVEAWNKYTATATPWVTMVSSACMCDERDLKQGTRPELDSHCRSTSVTFYNYVHDLIAPLIFVQ